MTDLDLIPYGSAEQQLARIGIALRLLHDAISRSFPWRYLPGLTRRLASLPNQRRGHTL